MRAGVADLLLAPRFARLPIFTTARFALEANVSVAVAGRALRLIAERGLLTRVVRGIWARTTHPDFSPYAVVPFLLGTSRAASREPGYVSLLSALRLHGIIDQIPRSIQVAVAHQRPTLRTPVGVYEFHRLQQSLMTGYEPGGKLANFELATPTKALFDTLYVSTRRGLRNAHLPEVELTPRVKDSEMRRFLGLVHSASLRTAVAVRWAALRKQLASTRE